MEWRRSLGGGAITEVSKNALEARRTARSFQIARKLSVGLPGVPEARFFRADSGSPTFHTQVSSGLVRPETPARGPVLGLQPVAPAKCAGPIAERAIPHRATVDEPDDDRSVQSRANHGMRLQTVRALHSPQDNRLVIGPSILSVVHARVEARVIPASVAAFLADGRMWPPRRSHIGRQRLR
jgi:hypothetical protein